MGEITEEQMELLKEFKENWLIEQKEVKWNGN